MKSNGIYWKELNATLKIGNSGIEIKFDCVKSFMNTDAFQKFSTKYGLDSEIVASFCESFATHVDLLKEKWFKYNPPIEVKVVAPIKV